VDEELFVVAEAVEVIQDGKVFCLVGVEGRWEDDAVGNAAGENFAGNGVAFDAAGGGCKREVKEVEEGNEVKEGSESFAVRS
jgi:hypothetical protein